PVASCPPPEYKTNQRDTDEPEADGGEDGPMRVVFVGLHGLLVCYQPSAVSYQLNLADSRQRKVDSSSSLNHAKRRLRRNDSRQLEAGTSEQVSKLLRRPFAS